MNLNEARVLAESLMRQHNLSHWKFKFNGRKTANGTCDSINQTISLSKHLTPLRDNYWVKNTILHEIAHALVGIGNNHNHIWRQKAIEIGCTGERCSSDVVNIKKNYIGTCPNCKTVIYRFRRKRISCSKCCPTFNLNYLFVWEEL